jgi:F-type H+-transporting ATPase subunit alpha
MRSSVTDLMNSINESGDYNDDVAASLRQAVEDFKANGTW